MDWGTNFSGEFAEYFRKNRRDIKLRKHGDVQVRWGGNIYPLQLQNINRNRWRLRWDGNRSKEFLKKLRRTFIQSYIVLKGQREAFVLKKTKKAHFRTMLPGGQQEVLIFHIVTPRRINCEVFIQIKHDWNALFERLADANVFGWLFDKEGDHLIAASTKWMSVKEFEKHAAASNVVYYLAHTGKKRLYVGKAEHLGERVRPGEKHQGMPAGWDKFRYDILLPKYAGILDKVEDHTIRVLAHVLKSKKGISSLAVGGYRLVNQNWRRL